MNHGEQFWINKPTNSSRSSLFCMRKHIVLCNLDPTKVMYCHSMINSTRGSSVVRGQVIRFLVVLTLSFSYFRREPLCVYARQNQHVILVNRYYAAFITPTASTYRLKSSLKPYPIQALTKATSHSLYANARREFFIKRTKPVKSML